jgi:hypothetical protein
VVTLAGRQLHAYALVDAAAAAADVLDSSVFFVVVLADRLLVRIETDGRAATPDASAALHAALGDVPVEIEIVPRDELLDVELLGRSPHVYKPIVLSDWTRPGRRVLTVMQGMIEWPRPTAGEMWRWMGRTFRTATKRRSLARSLLERSRTR